MTSTPGILARIRPSEGLEADLGVLFDTYANAYGRGDFAGAAACYRYPMLFMDRRQSIVLAAPDDATRQLAALHAFAEDKGVRGYACAEIAVVHACDEFAMVHAIWLALGADDEVVAQAHKEYLVHRGEGRALIAALIDVEAASSSRIQAPDAGGVHRRH